MCSSYWSFSSIREYLVVEELWALDSVCEDFGLRMSGTSRLDGTAAYEAGTSIETDVLSTVGL